MRSRLGSYACRLVRPATGPGAGPSGQVGFGSEMGVEALRALLADAVAHREGEAAARWAEDLRTNPRCTLGDIPTCLQALVDSSPTRYRAMLAPLEDIGRSTRKGCPAPRLALPDRAGCGGCPLWRIADPAAARKPPIALGIAEALRATHRWSDLEAWVEQGDWGAELGFLGRAYGWRPPASWVKAPRRIHSGGACTPTGARAGRCALRGRLTVRMGLPQGGGRSPLGRVREAGPGLPGARHPGTPLPGAARRGGAIPGVQPAECNAAGRPRNREQLCLLRGAHRRGEPNAHRAHSRR